MFEMFSRQFVPQILQNFFRTVDHGLKIDRVTCRPTCKTEI